MNQPLQYSVASFVEVLSKKFFLETKKKIVS